MKYFAFDLETTGLDCNKDEPVEIGFAVVEDEKRVYVNNLLVATAAPIHPKAQEVHQIDASTSAVGLSPRAIVHILEDLFSRHDFAGIVGYNAFRFDVPMLQSFLNRHGGTIDLRKYHCEDPALWYLAENIFGRPRPKTNDENRAISSIRIPQGTRFNLTVMCERMGIPFSNAHRAATDLKATVAVWRKMKGDVQERAA